jgi:predicted nucleic acid-binding protein
MVARTIASLPNVWLNFRLSSYDASYVALAEAIDATLLTLDKRIARAPGVRLRCEVATP